MLRDGYPWAGRLRDGTAAVPARVLGRRAAVVGRPAGVRRFYDPRLTRRRAFPMPIQLVLFGPGTVHSLDDAEHHHRKAMFLEVLTPDAVAALGRRAEQEWESSVRRWAGRDRVVLFVAFDGKARHEHPDWRRRIADGDEPALAAFVQEVRHLYPFVPVLAAPTRTAQDVLGVPLPRGGLVVLDVHGTDHDPAQWPDPDRFDPDRFLEEGVDLDALVPQGGGDAATGHRCPREAVTLTMLALATRVLARTPHTLPPQDLGYDLSRIPTRPRSGVVLELPGGAR